MMKGQIAGLMKQAQAMQDNMKKMQDELAQVEVEGQSGAGLVKIIMTCKFGVKRVTIAAQGVGDEPVLGGVAHGDDQVAVKHDRVVLVVVLVLVVAVAWDLDNDVYRVHGPVVPFSM